MRMSSRGRWLTVVGAAVVAAMPMTLPQSRAATVATATTGPVFTVYLSPTGADTNSGESLASPVRTLSRAQQVIKQANPQTNVEIRIKQGAYVAPPLVWDTYIAGHTISFMPLDYRYGDADTIAGRPIFSGFGAYGYWISAKLPSGHPGGPTNLRFYYLQVQDYANGLIFEGKHTTNPSGIRVPASEGLNNNTVYGMKFYRIGSKYAYGKGRGAITLQSSSDNVIRNNHFVNVENDPSELSLLHALYIAHHSGHNVITSNRFDTVSGDPVRVRNDSNDNWVDSNVFDRTGIRGFYSEWFCGSTCVDGNPGHPRECASHGNWFRYNTTSNRVGYQGGVIATWDLTPTGNATTGGPGCSNESQDRVRTAGNS